MQQDEWHRGACLIKVCHQLHCRRVSASVEQNELIRLLLQPSLCFLDRPGMIELSSLHASIALQNLSYQEEIFFPVADEQNSNRDHRGLHRC
jgi:hypothetical protein